MADFYSYIPTLCRYLRIINPKRILEWGPGQSTRIMLQICPDAEVISIEDSQTYFDEYKGLGSGTAKVHIYHVPIKDGYSSYPLVFGGIFDLIFVDGKDDQRPECLQTAYNMLSADGVCILHDSERENYVEAIKSFKVLEDVNGTVVLTK